MQQQIRNLDTEHCPGRNQSSLVIYSIETMETGSRAGAMVHWATENNMSLFHCKCYIMFHSSVGDIKLCSSCPDVALLPHTRALNEPSRRYNANQPTCPLWSLLLHLSFTYACHAFKHSVLNVKVLVCAFNQEIQLWLWSILFAALDTAPYIAADSSGSISPPCQAAVQVHKYKV